MFTPSTFVPPSSPSPNLQTFLAYAAALNAWDPTAILAVFDDTLEHRILPKSLGRPVLNKQKYSEYFSGMMPMFKWFKLTVHELIEVDDKITVHASSTGESMLGTPYTNEYMLMFHFVPPKEGGDGLPKISMMKEFVDSQGSVAFFGQERAKIAAAKAAAEEHEHAV